MSIEKGWEAIRRMQAVSDEEVASMATDTKAVARYGYDGCMDVVECPDGEYVLLTDHERVAGELCSTMLAMNDKHFSDFNKLGELLKHRDRELAASRAEVEWLKKDAERYRWLRDSKLSRHWNVTNTRAVGRGHEFSYRGATLDTAIDAAMEKGNV